MARFEPVRRKARFHRSGFTDQQMLGIANRTADSIRERIHSGLDVNDAPAPGLRPGYEKRKARKSPPAVRNWTYTGRTLRCLKVLAYSANHAIISFTDAVSNLRAYWNNRRHRQFGVSPQDRQVLVEAVRDARSTSNTGSTQKVA